MIDKQIITLENVSELVDELNKVDKDNTWYVASESESDTQWAATVYTSDKNEGMGMMYAAFMPRGYQFVQHDVVGTLPKGTLNVFTEFFSKHSLPARSVFIRDEFVDDIFDNMLDNLEGNPWDPAEYNDVMSVMSRIFYYLSENYSDDETALTVIEYLKRFLSMDGTQLIDQRNLARVSIEVSQAEPNAELILNMKEVHAYNHDNPDSLYLVVAGVDPDTQQGFISPCCMSNAEAVQLALIGYTAHVQSPFF